MATTVSLDQSYKNQLLIPSLCTIVLVAVAMMATLIPPCAYASQSQDTLCKEDEQVVFSCKLNPSVKTVSICSSKKLNKNVGYLKYRFGRSSSAIELEYPAKKIHPSRAFKYYSSFSPKASIQALSFKIGAYRYSFYSTTAAFGTNESGIRLDKSSTQISSMSCIDSSFISNDDIFLPSVGLTGTIDDVSYGDSED